MNIKAFLDEPLMQRQPRHSARSRTLRDMSLSPKSLIFFAVVLLAGVLGGTAAYQVVQASSPQPAPRESLIVDSTADNGADKAAGKVKARQGGQSKFAPCRRPARLEDGTCVTDVVRTVTVPGGSPVAAAPPQAPAPAPTPAAPSGGGPQSHHHGGHDDSGHDDSGHHGGDDDDDDDDSGQHHGGDDDDHDDDDDHSGHGHGGDDDDDDDSGHHGDDD
jgi:hypothetical protein